MDKILVVNDVGRVSSPKMDNKLDACQNRSLRFILGIEQSYWSRVTNDEVMARADLARDSIPEIEWGDLLINREIKMDESGKYQTS